MIRASLFRTVKSVAWGLVALQLGACATPQLDRRIAALNEQISVERETLAPLAAPYRGRAGQDVQFDVTGRPVEDTVEAFNKLGFNDRTMTVKSYGYSGYIARVWTDCPWPLPGRIGFEVVPAFNQAFYGALHVDHIDHSWNENDGLAFRIKNTLGLAGFVVGGKVEFCKLSGTIPISVALVGLGATSATGSTSLDTPNGDSMTYHVRLTQPIYMLAYVVTPVFSGTVPLWLKLELTKGKIPTTLGQKGSIQITPTGQRRDYVLVVRLDQAAFLRQGLTASGKVDVKWQAPTKLPPTAAGTTTPKQ